MTDKEFRRLSRGDLVEVIHHLQQDGQAESEDLPTPEQVDAERAAIQQKSRYRRTLLSTVSVLIVVAAIAVLLASLFLPVIQISGDSMEPTLHDGDVLLLLKTKRYDTGELCCVSWQNKLLIKRVIGTPGDFIIMDDEGNVYLNGVLLDEPYVTNKSLGECDMTFPYQVSDGRLFVMGDRRDISIDSRSAMIGCVEEEQVVGRVLFKIWPLGNSGSEDSEDTQ